MPFRERRPHRRNAAAGDDSRALGAGFVVIGEHLAPVFRRDQWPERHPGFFRCAELQSFCPLFQRRNEAVEDRPLDVESLRAKADLPAILEHRAGGARHGDVEVGICKDDAGVLPAELEAHRAHAFCRGGHDGFAGAALAGERDRSHLRVTAQEFAGRVRAESVDDVVDALRDADGVHHFAEEGRRGRCLFRGFHDHGVAAGERRGDLPRQQQQGQVPRADHADDPERRTDRVVQRRAAIGQGSLEGFGRHVLDEIGEGLEVGRAPRDIDLPRQRQRLAGVGDFGLQEVVEAPFDFLRYRLQQLGPATDGHATPFALESGTRGLHRGIDFRMTCLVNQTEEAVVGRGALLERPARGGAVGCDPLRLQLEARTMERRSSAVE